MTLLPLLDKISKLTAELVDAGRLDAPLLSGKDTAGKGPPVPLAPATVLGRVAALVTDGKLIRLCLP